MSEVLAVGDGIEVGYRRWLPEGEPTAIVLVAHGMSEHGGRYRRLAEALVARGWAVYAPDHRGFGLTAGSTGVGRAGEAGVAGIVEDLRDLVTRAKEDVGDLPVVLVGHSMGAMLAHAFAARWGSELAGLALSGTGGVAEGVGDLATGMRGMVDAGMGDDPMPMLSTFNEAFEPARTPFDWLSRDEAEVDAYLADPLCGDSHPPTFRFLAEMLELVADTTSAEGLDRLPRELPVLLLTGDRDPASNMAENVRALEQALRDRGLDIEAHYYPDARHEVFNETNRDEVMGDLVSWIERVLG